MACVEPRSWKQFLEERHPWRWSHCPARSEQMGRKWQRKPVRSWSSCSFWTLFRGKKISGWFLRILILLASNLDTKKVVKQSGENGYRWNYLVGIFRNFFSFWIGWWRGCFLVQGEQACSWNGTPRGDNRKLESWTKGSVWIFPFLYFVKVENFWWVAFHFSDFIKQWVSGVKRRWNCLQHLDKVLSIGCDVVHHLLWFVDHWHPIDFKNKGIPFLYVPSFGVSNIWVRILLELCLKSVISLKSIFAI